MRELLVGMKKGGAHFWSLIWICFLYGVFHAVGPGHGKVVISSYMFANDIAMRRGVIISMLASLMQGLTAISAIGFFVLALRGSGIRTGDLAYGLEIASYVGIMVLGVWLLWRKLLGNKHRHHHNHAQNHAPKHNHEYGLVHAHAYANAHNHHHDTHVHEHAHSHDDSHGHLHINHDDVCDHCGHSHAPDPNSLEGRFGVREAWSAVLAVGLRPCTGALIVLVFCFANGLYLVGIASTIAMSIGTGLAVSSLAILAVTAKTSALRFVKAQDTIAKVQNGIEIFGALLIMLIGFVLLSAAVQ
ncbi:MAG: nickel/cobalt transporter [Pseudomonadota bacterium]